jgi:hypothetical protein
VSAFRRLIPWAALGALLLGASVLWLDPSSGIAPGTHPDQALASPNASSSPSHASVGASPSRQGAPAPGLTSYGRTSASSGRALGRRALG